jgi:hypothetical protein
VLEALAFPLLLALAFRLEGRLPLPALGVWLNLLWFVYQNEWGSGWLAYLRGLGIGLFLWTYAASTCTGNRGLKSRLSLPAMSLRRHW